ncbi:phosphatase PAP2 family protein [Falsiporphyromonas endometrii]|uniref:Phosphatase PAP2 family protein n=1 Tax=Falsiporphyromonas endometrii TaxID=1387297 RepID=A0ABV9K4Z3_9PORP
MDTPQIIEGVTQKRRSWINALKGFWKAFFSSGAIEMAVLSYVILTSFLILIFYNRIPSAKFMLIIRGEVVFGTLVLFLLYFRTRSKIAWILRVAFQITLLSYWYGETYEFNCLFPNLDHLFATIEEMCFFTQPALFFHEMMPQWWFSEILHFAYFIYFALFVGTMVYYYAVDYSSADRVVFIILASFFLYYVIYIFVPVAGPQFYYPAIGLDDVIAGVFPSLGDYFAHHKDLMPGPGYPQGIFYRLVSMTQAVGERPTAAFPSSHVGITTIVLVLVSKAKGGKLIFPFLLVVYVCLCLATVYIQAHYLIDVFAGIASGCFFWWLTNYLYTFFFSDNRLHKYKIT